MDLGENGPNFVLKFNTFCALSVLIYFFFQRSLKQFRSGHTLHIFLRHFTVEGGHVGEFRNRKEQSCPAGC